MLRIASRDELSHIVKDLCLGQCLNDFIICVIIWPLCLSRTNTNRGMSQYGTRNFFSAAFLMPSFSEV